MGTEATNGDLFLPEPEPRDGEVHGDLGRRPRRRAAAHVRGAVAAPRSRTARPKIVETRTGHQVWEFEGQRYTQVGMNAVAGRRPETVKMEPFRFDQMRPGCYDVDARVRDMDINGVWASVNFPSQITGFCGSVFSGDRRPRRWAPRACARGTTGCSKSGTSRIPSASCRSGSRFSPTPRSRPTRSAATPARGFTSVTFPERPHAIGLPSLWERDHWDPIIAACAETDTVISLHVGSSGIYPYPAGSPASQLAATLFGQLALGACAEWLWSEYPVQHPDLKIAMSEGGIGWVAMLLDRLDYIVDNSSYGQGWTERPSDVLKRNFWFCTLEDRSTIDTRHRIGVEHIMVEVDYPARRQQLARHASGHREDVGSHTCAGAARDVQRKRRRALPPPAARGRAPH